MAAFLFLSPRLGRRGPRPATACGAQYHARELRRRAGDHSRVREEAAQLRGQGPARLRVVVQHVDHGHRAHECIARPRRGYEQ
jgi:hypothetical protein